jgi:hypothetical protein
VLAAMVEELGVGLLERHELALDEKVDLAKQVADVLGNVEIQGGSPTFPVMLGTGGRSSIVATDESSEIVLSDDGRPGDVS